MDDSPVLIIRKMINVKELKSRLADEPDKLEMIRSG